MAIQTQIFRLLAGNVMQQAPLEVRAGTSCGELVTAMTDRNASSALVTDGDGVVIGIVTERDVTQRIALKAAPDTPVEQVMTSPVQTVRRSDYLYRAISLMRRQGIRHMPVVDRPGRLVGILNLDDAVAVAVQRLMDQIDRLTAEGTVEGLRSVKKAQVQLAEELSKEAVPAAEIQQLLTDINRDLYRRIVKMAVAAMEEDGWGAPPVAFEVLIMGSGGRGESFLRPDQDNGLILDDYPDSEHDRIDGYFIELATRMTRDLDAIGFPYCRGNVMATNPLWRKSIQQWLDQTANWGRKRNFIVARLVGIFFDFRAAFDRGVMTQRLREHVTHVMGESQGFLRELYQDEADHGTALGWFSRLQVERDSREHKGQINLKAHGTLPLVEFIRLLSLREGIPETRTVQRIALLKDAGALNRDQREYLTLAFNVLTTLLLRQQIADYQAGRKVSNYVNPETLSKLEREQLVESFRSIEDLRSKVRSEFTGDVF